MTNEGLFVAGRARLPYCEVALAVNRPPAKADPDPDDLSGAVRMNPYPARAARFGPRHGKSFLRDLDAYPTFGGGRARSRQLEVTPNRLSIFL